MFTPEHNNASTVSYDCEYTAARREFQPCLSKNKIIDCFYCFIQSDAEITAPVRAWQYLTFDIAVGLVSQ